MISQRTLLHTLLILYISSTAITGAADQPTIDQPQTILDWIRQRGGQSHLVLSKPCPTCFRGLYAPKPFKRHALLMSVPLNKAAILLPNLNRAGLAAEYAYHFVLRMHLDPEFNKTYGPVLDTLPSQDESFSAEVWSQQHRVLLQFPQLAEEAEYISRSTEQIFYGTWPEHTSYTHLPKLLAAKGANTTLDVDTFKHIASLLGSRYMGATSNSESSSYPEYYVVPGIDMINHANSHTPECNVYMTDSNGYMKIWAKRRIDSGEEVRIDYQPDVLHRPDPTLLTYGFFVSSSGNGTKEGKRGKPLMCAMDLPTFHEHGNPFEETPLDDSSFYGGYMFV